MRIRLLGPLAIEHQGRLLGPGDFGGRKPKQLLEILLTNRGHVVSKRGLGELLWPNDAPLDTHATIETYVSVLRRRLEPGNRRARESSFIVRRGSGYVFDTAAAEIDADRFDRLLAEAKSAQAAHDLAGARNALTEARLLRHGVYLEDEPDASWAIRARASYDRAHRDALVAAAELELLAGELQACVELAGQALDLDPSAEDATRIFIQCAYALGRQEDAIRAHEQLRKELLARFGTTPAPATDHLLRSVVQGIPPHLLIASSHKAGGLGPTVELPFVGRESELAQLTEWVMPGGGPSLIVIEGEAGIGKTRLAQQFLLRVAVTRAAATSSALDRDVPFATISSLLADLVDRAAPEVRELVLSTAPSAATLLFDRLPKATPLEPLPPEASRLRLLDSIAQALRAAAPVTVFIDDFHLADASSVQALGRVFQRAPEADIQLLVTLRSGSRPQGLAQLLGLAMSRGKLRRLPLGPFPRSAFESLVHLGRDPEELWATTGGHPLLLAERLRAAAGNRLEDVIAERLSAVPTSSLRVLEAASVLETSFDSAVLQQLLGWSEGRLARPLDRLLDAHLLVKTGDKFTFPHELIRLGAYTQIKPQRRRRLHLAAMTVLLEEGAAAGRVAHHAYQGGAWRAALDQSRAAAARAETLFANSEAESHYARAVAVLREHSRLAGPGEESRMLIDHARVLIVLGRTSEALPELEAALGLAASSGDHRTQLDATHWIAMSHQWSWRPTLALPHAEAALRLAERLGEPELVGRAHAALANPHGSLGNLKQALRHVRTSLRIYDELGREPPAGVYYRLGFIRHHRGQESAALLALDHCEDLAFRQHDESAIVLARWVRATALGNLGRYPEAFRALAMAESATKGEEVAARSRIPNTYGAFYADLGLWEEALEHDLHSLEVIESYVGLEVAEPRMQALLNLAEDRLHLGDPARAELHIGEVERRMPEAEFGRFRYRNRLHYVRGLLQLALGNPKEAFAAAGDCLRDAAHYSAPKYEIRARIVRAGALAAMGQNDLSLTESEAASRLAVRLMYPSWDWRVWAEAARLTGSSQAAARASKAQQRLAEGLDSELISRVSRVRR